jgi:glycosyltransferase involved in cell wall biosynthesis
VADVLRGLDVFVLPSRGEGVSNTILEAMATGLPVVATRVGANADLVADAATGRIVPPNDGDALAAAIVAYAGDAARAREHGRAGRARAEQHFSLDRMVERYHRLYLDAVGATQGAGHGAVAARGPVAH